MVAAELNVVSDPKLVMNVDIFRVRNNAFKILCSLIVLPSAEFRFLCFLATYPASHHLSKKAPAFSLGFRWVCESRELCLPELY